MSEKKEENKRQEKKRVGVESVRGRCDWVRWVSSRKEARTADLGD